MSVRRQRMSEEEYRLLLLLKRQRALAEARDDLLTFARVMKPDPDYPDDTDRSLYEVMLLHRAIAAALEQVESGKIRRLIITVPPRHGKSELASRLFPAWYLGRHPDRSIILATYADKLSWDFGREVEGYLVDPIYHQIFPNTSLATASVDRLETDLGGKVFFVGRGSTITGRGAHVFLIDDPLKDRVEADSTTTREKLWTWYNQVAKTRLMSFTGAIVIIATRWSEDDLIGRLIDPLNALYSPVEGPKWKVIDIPAIAGDNDRIGRKPGEALWPSHFPVEYLQELKDADPRGFEALYQGAPTPAKGNFFPHDKLLTYRRGDLPPVDKLRFYAASDHAVSARQERDKTCLMTIGLDEDENVWVLPDLIWGRHPTDYVVERMIDLMDQHRPLHWWAERGHITKSIGPFLRKRMLERRVFCSVYEMTPIADKLARAQSIMGRIAMGKVFWPGYASWWVEAERELLQFPYGAHDDLVDAASYIGLGLAMQQPLKRKTKETKVVRPGTLAWVKQAARDDERRRVGRNGGW
jgi:predicted phage terminase large subunit-like protein